MVALPFSTFDYKLNDLNARFLSVEFTLGLSGGVALQHIVLVLHMHDLSFYACTIWWWLCRLRLLDFGVLTLIFIRWRRVATGVHLAYGRHPFVS